MNTQVVMSFTCIVLWLCASTDAADPKLAKAVKLIESVGDEAQRESLERWKAQVNFRTWKDATGKYSTLARYESSTEEAVILEKEDGSQVTVSLDRLDFDSHVRVKKIREMELEIVENGLALQEVLDAAEMERKRLELEERKRREAEASLTPSEREIRRIALELSEAGREEQRLLLDKIIERTGNDSVAIKYIGEMQWVMKRFDELVSLYADGKMTGDSVKVVLEKHGLGRTATIDFIEQLFFKGGNENLHLVLISDNPLTTRLDVYRAAGLSLHPDLRETYGFSYLEPLEYMGDQLYWGYKHEQLRLQDK